MDAFTITTVFVHIIAVLVLVSTIPHQIQDIWGESDDRYRKICWVVFIGTICLIAMNLVPFLQIAFYESPTERLFWNIANMFNGFIGATLGVLAHMMYRSSKHAFPRTIDDLEKRKKNAAQKTPRGHTKT